MSQLPALILESASACAAEMAAKARASTNVSRNTPPTRSPRASAGEAEATCAAAGIAGRADSDTMNARLLRRQRRRQRGSLSAPPRAKIESFIGAPQFLWTQASGR